MLKKILQKSHRKSTELNRHFLYSSKLKKHHIPYNQKRILCYHGLDLKGNTQISSKFISKVYFEQQLIYFKQHFNVVSLSEYKKLHHSTEHPFSIAITFDDGYKNNFKYVLPLLEKYQIPATFFITGITELGYDMLWGDLFDLAFHTQSTPFEFEGEHYKKNFRGQYLRTNDQTPLKQLIHSYDFAFKKHLASHLPPGSNQFKNMRQYDDYWQQMSKSEIQQLAQSPYAQIGVHGWYHNNLAKVSIQNALEDLKQCKTFLENTTQQSINELAFPYGQYTDALIGACKTIGFQTMLALDYLSDLRDDTLFERFGMNPFISWQNQLHYLLKGNYQ